VSFFGRLNVVVGQTPQSLTVSSTSVEIVAANSLRAAIVMANVGTEDCWITADVTAVVNKGGFLGKNGGSLAMDSTFLTRGALNGIAVSAKDTTISFQEFHAG